jgi:hypothetical protein
MNHHITNIRKFKRGLFTISVDAYEEPNLDLSFDTDGETRTKIEQGRLTPFCVKASLSMLGHSPARARVGGGWPPPAGGNTAASKQPRQGETPCREQP